MARRFVLWMVLVGALAFTYAPAWAYTVTLDGVANATASDNPTTYLKIVDRTDPSIIYYQWTTGSGSLPWADLTALANDLTVNHTYVGGNNWQVFSGGDPFNNPGAVTVWKTLTLPAGFYDLKLASNSAAYNLKSFDWPNENGAGMNVWNAYVQMYGVYTGGQGTVSYPFGGYDGYWQTTEADALAYYRQNVDGELILLLHETELHFYINDCNALDNAGSVTLEIDPTCPISTIPLPGSLSLLGPGLAMLGAWGLWRRRSR